MDKLPESAEILLAVFNAMPDPTVLNRVSDGKYIMVNDGYLSLSGYSREEVLSTNSKDLNIWHDYADRQTVLETLKNTGIVRNLKVDFRMKNGVVRKCLLSGTFLTHGGELHVLLTARDVSQMLEAEEKMKKQEFWLTEAQRIGKLGSYEFRIQENYWTSTQILNAILGIEEEYKKTIETWNEIVHPEERTEMYDYFASIMRERKPFDKEYRIIRKNDGVIRWVHGWGEIKYDGSGIPAAMIGTIQDITERKLDEIKIRESEERFKKIFETSPDIIAISRMRDGMFTMVNDRFLEVTGYKRDEVIGKTPVQIQLYNDSQQRDMVIRMLRERKPVNSVQVDYRMKDNTVKACLLSAEMIMLDNEPFTIANVKDISERIKAEKERESIIRELEQKNAELERFAYTVSHDLRTPLFTINGFAGMIKKEAAVSGQENINQHIDIVINAAKTMDTQLKDLLEISKIGRIVNKYENVSAGAVVREALSLLGGEIVAANAHLIVSPELQDETVYADKVRLREVFQNLVSNAIKFRTGSNCIIEIGVKRGYKGHKAVFYVKDCGMGIDKNHLERIFGLFNRLNQEVEGTGIGLAIVKRIVEVHSGKVWAESEGLGKGSGFFFTFGSPAD